MGDDRRNVRSRPILFYVAHIVLAHLAAGIVALATGHGLEILTNVFVFYPRDWGFGLPVVAVWLLSRRGVVSSLP